MPPGSPVFGAPLDQLPNDAHRPDLPAIFWKFVTYLQTQANVEGIFRVSGSLDEINKLKGSLNNNKDEVDFFAINKPHVISVLFKQLFRDLPEPLLDAGFITIFDERNRLARQYRVRKLLQKMNPKKKIVLKELLLLLQIVSSNSASKMTPDNLSVVFTPNLLPSSSVISQNSEIVSELIENVDNLFINDLKKLVSIETSTAKGVEEGVGVWADLMKDEYNETDAQQQTVYFGQLLSQPETLSKILSALLRTFSGYESNGEQLENVKKFLMAVLEQPPSLHLSGFGHVASTLQLIPSNLHSQVVETAVSLIIGDRKMQHSETIAEGDLERKILQTKVKVANGRMDCNVSDATKKHKALEDLLMISSQLLQYCQQVHQDTANLLRALPSPSQAETHLIFLRQASTTTLQGNPTSINSLSQNFSQSFSSSNSKKSKHKSKNLKKSGLISKNGSSSDKTLLSIFASPLDQQGVTLSTPHLLTSSNQSPKSPTTGAKGQRETSDRSSTKLAKIKVLRDELERSKKEEADLEKRLTITRATISATLTDLHGLQSQVSQDLVGYLADVADKARNHWILLSSKCEKHSVRLLTVMGSSLEDIETTLTYVQKSVTETNSSRDNLLSALPSSSNGASLALFQKSQQTLAFVNEILQSIQREQGGLILLKDSEVEETLTSIRNELEGFDVIKAKIEQLLPLFKNSTENITGVLKQSLLRLIQDLSQFKDLEKVLARVNLLYQQLEVRESSENLNSTLQRIELLGEKVGGLFLDHLNFKRRSQKASRD
eukprot:TRINITY_DN4980_c0_g1_i1.p1 TRINITY_DN4980_c0_g1~~TRINITY_DN4980_c0_g1_i1.p1  ORF type:complete len:777 (+),score=166.82 TRINITY_DN4980_c0_g1_i1:136-2466(+)